MLFYLFIESLFIPQIHEGGGGKVGYRTYQDNKYNKKSGTYKEINIGGTKPNIVNHYISYMH